MKESRRWLRYGCVGCLSVVGLLFLFSAGLGGVAWLKASSEQLTSHETDHPLAAASPGAVIVEIRAQVELEIEPGPEGSPLRTTADYDERSFELREGLEGSGDGSGGWTYRLTFRRTGSSWLGSLSRLFGASQPRLRLQLPADVPLSLNLVMSEGGAEARFGGLWLTSADLEMSKGGIHLEFGEPMREPMESLAVRAAMGGFHMEGLGNASPRKLDIDCSMGGGFIGLDGAWAADSEIDVHVSMGGAALQLPHDVHVVGVETSRVRRADEGEISLPTLSFNITTGMGGDVDVIE